ncbi:enolase-phosphatase E1-like [Oppia nitens]|uniref:enolase-phosphatase E1-like n=1 Tax=Oppia nitens TaxID=1686743 RepID=UPI0023DA0EF1|nr:enolase-phosphatase E1-like [Oppia nitens]
MGQLKLQKPKVIIMDVIGTAVKLGFIEKILIPYVKSDIKEYLTEKWTDKNLKKNIERMRKESEKDGESGAKIAAANAPEAEQQESVATYVLAAVDAKKESKGLQMFKFYMWFYGFEKGKLETPVYSDVPIQARKWKDMDVKLYMLSNGWTEFTKRALSKTSHGDLNLLIDGHYDSSEGQLNNKETYTKLLAKLKVKPDECLFMTKSAEAAHAAKEAGISILLVLTHRKNIEKLTEEEKQMPRIRSFNELEFSSKEGGGEGAAQPPAEANA